MVCVVVIVLSFGTVDVFLVGMLSVGKDNVGVVSIDVSKIVGLLRLGKVAVLCFGALSVGVLDIVVGVLSLASA